MARLSATHSQICPRVDLSHNKDVLLAQSDNLRGGLMGCTLRAAVLVPVPRTPPLE